VPRWGIKPFGSLYAALQLGESPSKLDDQPQIASTNYVSTQRTARLAQLFLRMNTLGKDKPQQILLSLIAEFMKNNQ